VDTDTDMYTDTATDTETETGDSGTPATDTAPVPTAESWVVHKALEPALLTLGPNLVVNGSLDRVDGDGAFEGWSTGVGSWSADDTVVRSAPYSGRADAPDATGWYGGYQKVPLGGTTATLLVQGWSRAEAVSGANGSDYSLYLDFADSADSLVQTEVLPFSPGTHDWEGLEQLVQPVGALERVRFYPMFRYTQGTAWFDDLGIYEVQDTLIGFDGETALAEDAPVPEVQSQLTLVSADARLSLTLDAPGGTVGALSVDGVELGGTDHRSDTGFFVRDQADGSDWVHFGGSVVDTGDALVQEGSAGELGLSLQATWTAAAGHLEVSGTVTDTTATDRAITLYLALPAGSGDGTWWHAIRDDRPLTATGSFESLREIGSDEPVGARGAKGRYPFGGVGRDAAGLGVGWPLDAPQYARTGFHADTGQLVIAVDLGLSTAVARSPSAGDFRFVVLPVAPEHGFRGLVQAYRDALPELFERRVGTGGLWVAFDDLSGLADPDDFGLRFHEIGDGAVPDPDYTASDDAADILTFRYLYEPGMDPIELPEGTATDDPAQVLAVVEALYAAGQSSNEVEARGALTSVVHDRDGQPRMEVLTGRSWCPEPCARFFVNADPELDPGSYGENWTTDHWNAEAQADYDETAFALDGEYIDSLTTRAEVLNYNPEHFATADHSPVYAQGVFEPALLGAWSNLEGLEHVFADFTSDGRLRMANLDLSAFGFYVHTLDVLGVEHGWRDDDGVYERVDDSHLSLLRVLAGPRPFGFLNNVDYSTLSDDEVLSYLEACLFWGFGPSFFDDTGGGDTFWSRPELTDAYRPLFQAVMPTLLALDEAGWEPVSHVAVSDEGLWVERFGTGPVYLTLYNAGASEGPQAVVDVGTLGTSDSGQVVYGDGEDFSWTPTGTELTVTAWLDPGETTVIRLDP